MTIKLITQAPNWLHDTCVLFVLVNSLFNDDDGSDNLPGAIQWWQYNCTDVISVHWFEKNRFAAGLGCDTKTLLLTEGEIIKMMTVERLKK